MFFLLCFTLELAYSYYYTNTLHLKPTHALSKFEKQLADIFYEGLEEECVKKQWFVRNFNFIFTGRFILISLLIYNLQYL